MKDDIITGMNRGPIINPLKYPSVKCAVATCWEEGPKAYHTCNNSWYTLFDGGPWAPCKYYGQLKK